MPEDIGPRPLHTAVRHAEYWRSCKVHRCVLGQSKVRTDRMPGPRRPSLAGAK